MQQLSRANLLSIRRGLAKALHHTAMLLLLHSSLNAVHSMKQRMNRFMRQTDIASQYILHHGGVGKQRQPTTPVSISGDNTSCCPHLDRGPMK